MMSKNHVFLMMLLYGTFLNTIGILGNKDAPEVCIKSSDITSDYYPIEENPNCPQKSVLSLLFGHASSESSFLSIENESHISTCCTFQDEVVVDENAEDSKHGLNLLHVFMGQIILSHDTGETLRSDTDKITVKCADGRLFSFGVLIKDASDTFGNEETACIDGSVVYSSLMSSTHLLTKSSFPKLTVNHDIRGTCSLNDCPVPMDNPLHLDPAIMYAVGDTRGNESPVLNSLHIMWAIRHNQWVEHYAKEYPLVDDLKIFGKARARIIAEIQRVSKIYVETLIGKEITYDKNRAHSGEKVQLFAEFSQAINRMQHTQIKTDIPIAFANGSSTLVNLNSAFFNPELIHTYGISAILRGAATTSSSSIGLHFVREFIGDLESTHSPNLAIFDCHRGRELGFKSYNAIRKDLFGDEIHSFQDVTSNKKSQRMLSKIYNGDHKNIDLFVGGLAEDHEPGSFIGKTFSMIMMKQMEEFMYNDEGWFEGASTTRPLSDAEMEEVRHTMVSDILLQSTSIGCVPQYAFFVPGPLNPLVCTDNIHYQTPFKTDTLV